MSVKKKIQTFQKSAIRGVTSDTFAYVSLLQHKKASSDTCPHLLFNIIVMLVPLPNAATAVPTCGGNPKAGYQLGWCIWDALLKPLISSEL